MTWRICSRGPDGKEDVSYAATLEEAVAKARQLLVQGCAIMRLESDHGEIVEGKQLQEALAARPERGTIH